MADNRAGEYATWTGAGHRAAGAMMLHNVVAVLVKAGVAPAIVAGATGYTREEVAECLKADKQGLYNSPTTSLSPVINPDGMLRALAVLADRVGSLDAAASMLGMSSLVMIRSTFAVVAVPRAAPPRERIEKAFADAGFGSQP